MSGSNRDRAGARLAAVATDLTRCLQLIAAHEQAALTQPRPPTQTSETPGLEWEGFLGGELFGSGLSRGRLMIAEVVGQTQLTGNFPVASIGINTQRRPRRARR